MGITGIVDPDFLAEQHRLYQLDSDRIPQHVAIIMDGNGRWAQKKGRPRIFGHKAGAEALRKTIQACKDLGIRYLSVYAFSTENWQRPSEEVSFLMSFFVSLLKKEAPALHKEGAKIKVLGDKSALSDELLASIDAAESLTASNQHLQFNIMLNYGSKREIASACQQLFDDIKSGEASEISEAAIAERLYTAGLPDPEILIRPGQEYRLSNFMVWQLAYAELFFTDTLWPDFSKDDLVAILRQYQQRDRRFGGVK